MILSFDELTAEQQKLKSNTRTPTLAYAVAFDSNGRPTYETAVAFDSNGKPICDSKGKTIYKDIDGVQLEIARNHHILGQNAKGVLPKVPCKDEETAFQQVLQDSHTEYQGKSFKRSMYFEGIDAEKIWADKHIFANYQQSFPRFIPSGLEMMLANFDRILTLSESLSEFRDQMSVVGKEVIRTHSILQRSDGAFIHNNITQISGIKIGGVEFNGTIHEVLEYDKEGNVHVRLFECDNKDLFNLICTMPFHLDKRIADVNNFGFYLDRLSVGLFGQEELQLMEDDYGKMYKKDEGNVNDLSFAILDLETSFLARGFLGKDFEYSEDSLRATFNKQPNFYVLSAEILKIRQKLRTEFFAANTPPEKKQKILSSLNHINRKLYNFQVKAIEKGEAFETLGTDKLLTKIKVDVQISSMQNFAAVAKVSTLANKTEIIEQAKELRHNIKVLYSKVKNIAPERTKALNEMLRALQSLLEAKQNGSNATVAYEKEYLMKAIKDLQPRQNPLYNVSIFRKLFYADTKAVIDSFHKFIETVDHVAPAENKREVRRDDHNRLLTTPPPRSGSPSMTSTLTQEGDSCSFVV